MEEYPKIKHGFLHVNKDVACRVKKITEMRRIENVVYIFIENQTMIHTITCDNEIEAKNVYNQLVTGLKSDS